MWTPWNLPSLSGETSPVRRVDGFVSAMVEHGARTPTKIALTFLYLGCVLLTARFAPTLVVATLMVGFAAFVLLTAWWGAAAYVVACLVSGALTSVVTQPVALIALLLMPFISFMLGVAARKYREVSRLRRILECQKSELELLVLERALAEQKGALSLERLTHQLDLARRVQEHLVCLPEESLRVGRFSLHLSGASRASCQVGGDFYRVIRLGPQSVALIVGDVMGRGVASALVMAMSVALFEDAARLSHTPEGMLEQVNGRLCECLGGRLFVTAVVVVVDGERRQWHCASAGHEAALLMSGRRVRPLAPPPALPLGVSADETYTPVSARIRAGERLVLYTDGLTGAEEGRLNRRSLRHLLPQVSHMEASPLLSWLNPTAGEDDDVTLLVADLRAAPVERRVRHVRLRTAAAAQRALPAAG